MRVTLCQHRRAVTKHSTVRLKPPRLSKKRSRARRAQKQTSRLKVSVGLRGLVGRGGWLNPSSKAGETGFPRGPWLCLVEVLRGTVAEAPVLDLMPCPPPGCPMLVTGLVIRGVTSACWKLDQAFLIFRGFPHWASCHLCNSPRS